jgi:hypothetical protein
MIHQFIYHKNFTEYTFSQRISKMSSTHYLTNLLFKYISQSFELVSVLDTGSGKVYFPRSNVWNSKEDAEGPCCGDTDHEECIFTDVVKPKGDLVYNIDYSPDQDVFDTEEEEKQWSLFQEQGKEMEVFPKGKILILRNDNGVNDDHRGSDHTQIRLDFNEIWVCRGNKMADLAEAYFRVKSHKFENCYELLCGINSIKEINQGYIITLGFDHGS